MPAPQAFAMKLLAMGRFQSFRIRLPTIVGGGLPNRVGPATTYAQTQQQFGSPQSVRFVKPSIGSGGSGSTPQRGTPVPVPPALFVSASDDLRDIQNQRDMTDTYERLIGTTCAGICSAWSTWQSMATLVGVQINAVIAMGGQVVGPPWEPFIKAQTLRGSPWYAARTDAMADAVGAAWTRYVTSIRVPGMPWYPAFAAFPAPVAPPMPNVPCPIIALGGNRDALTAASLKSAMLARCADREGYIEQLFDSIAFAVDGCFRIWVAATMVTNVLGTGRIPTFAPPYVPVGPVIGGTGNMTPGGFV